MTNPITGTVTTTVDVGSADYPSPLTIDESGSVEPTASGAVAVTNEPSTYASLTTAGYIAGGAGTASVYHTPPTAGGAGIYFNAGAYVNNTGTIRGGAGGAGYFKYAGYDGGVGVDLSAAGIFKNSGTGAIHGGRGGDSAGGQGGIGGAGVSAYSSALTNSAKIYGGQGGDDGNKLFGFGGAGGTGVDLAGTSSLANSADGQITGGESGGVLLSGGGGGSTYFIPEGVGGAGVTLVSGSSASLQNAGSITGGAGEFAAAGVSQSGGTSYNTGTITGGVGGGVGVDLLVGTANNSGTITGGASSGSGGTTGRGVYIAAGATLNNYQTGGITGGYGFDGATGGTGVYIQNGGTLNNTDTAAITGGEGAIGGTGVAQAKYATLHIYAGTITGGAATYGVGAGDNGGVGISVAQNATLITSAGITGGKGVTYKYYDDGVGSSGGAGVQITGGQVNNSGTITGGTGGGSYAGGGSNPGLQGGAGGAGVYLNGGELVTAGTISGGSGGAGASIGQSGDAVQFGTSTPATMVVESGAKFYGDIGGFAVGDNVDVTNLTPPGSSYFDPNSTFTLNTPEGSLTFTGTTDETFLFNSDGSGGTIVTIACFRRGTQILTDRGEIAIESLRIGDQVTTLSGTLMPIRWIGRRSYSGDAAWGDREVLPILIRRGAIAKSVPTRDLWVSPEHAMYIDGMLIPASSLLNGVSIVQEERVDEATYFHLEFDAHEVIVAEGALSESFVDDESRQMFDNAAEYHKLYPQSASQPARFCAPRVEDGYELEAVRQRLAARAEMAASAGGAEWLAHRNRIGAAGTELRS
jgi:hypothetical protein